MRISILTPSASRNAGGLFNSVRRGAIEMLNQGVEVHAFAPKDNFSYADLRFWNPVNITTYSTFGPSKLGINLTLPNLIFHSKPQVIHLHGLWTYQSAVTRKSNIPVVISPRGMLDEWALNNSKLKKRVFMRIIEQENLRNVACFHALNQNEAHSIRAFGSRKPIAVIPNGIDAPMKPSDCVKLDWLSCESRKILVFLGRIHPKKGLVDLIKSWSILKTANPKIADSWTLVIAGWDDGGHFKYLKRLVNQLDLEDDIYFPGSVYDREKHALLSRSDAFILPSFSEGLPMSVLEAWAYRIPTFMTEHCNLSFAFDRGAAIKIENRPEEISLALEKWLLSEDLQSIGETAQRVAIAEFSWVHIVKEQRKLYDWLAGKSKQPSFVQSIE